MSRYVKPYELLDPMEQRAPGTKRTRGELDREFAMARRARAEQEEADERDRKARLREARKQWKAKLEEAP